MRAECTRGLGKKLLPKAGNSLPRVPPDVLPPVVMVTELSFPFLFRVSLTAGTIVVFWNVLIASIGLQNGTRLACRSLLIGMKMLRIAAFVGLIASPVTAQTAQQQIDLTRGYLECASVSGNTERLQCYDAMQQGFLDFASDISESVAAGTSDCEIEDFNYRPHGSVGIELTGSMSCPSGRMDYRLYNGEEFLTAGFTYFQGYSLRVLEDVLPVPENLSIRYTVE